MKIILSRKGFDSSNGEIPSPILPDGTLLSLPIPVENEHDTEYSQLSYGEKSYDTIINELMEGNSQKKPQLFNKQYCHLDPDIKETIYSNQTPNWKAAFGQSGAAQGHLRNECVKEGDIFLFFGWFKQTKLNCDGKYQYVKGSPDLHIIYGYLQIGEIYDNITAKDNLPTYIQSHAHARNRSQPNNCIYVATEKLSINENRKGADVLKYNPNLVLTKNGMSRSKWELPDFFKGNKISYHKDESFKDGYFQSAYIGQEFVISGNEKVENWARNIIETK